MSDRSLKRLSKQARRGMRGYPMGIVASYGPDDKRASKLVASVKTSGTPNRSNGNGSRKPAISATTRSWRARSWRSSNSTA